MASAFILFNAEIGAEDEVRNQLKEMKEVTECYVVYGVYDLIAKLEANNMENLKEAVTQNLRNMEKVRSTMTMICVDDKK